MHTAESESLFNIIRGAALAAPVQERDAIINAVQRLEHMNPMEGCTLEAVHTGEGWCLQVSYPDGHELKGEAIALLAWPESWPESVDGKFLGRAGFEVV